MIVGTLEVELRLDGCFNLKEKRRVLQSLIQRLRNDFHASVAEVGDHELWNSAVIGVAVISGQVDTVEAILNRVMLRVEADSEVELVSVSRSVERT